MQQGSKYPARRYIILILAVVVPLLSCCGGGGGTTASAPQGLGVSGGAGALRGSSVDRFFVGIEGSGERWVSLVESDSGYFPLRGRSVGTDGALSRLSADGSLAGIDTRYSRLSHISTRVGGISDPGRYVLRGSVYDGSVSGGLDFALRGEWSCVACGGLSAPIRSGSLSGILSVDGGGGSATLSLSGDGLSLSAGLSLGVDNELSSRVLPSSLELDGVRLTPLRSEILGSLFGGSGEEAGVLFGISDDDGQVFSGGASGSVSD